MPADQPPARKERRESFQISGLHTRDGCGGPTLQLRPPNTRKPLASSTPTARPHLSLPLVRRGAVIGAPPSVWPSSRSHICSQPGPAPPSPDGSLRACHRLATWHTVMYEPCPSPRDVSVGCLFLGVVYPCAYNIARHNSAHTLLRMGEGGKVGCGKTGASPR